MQLCFPPARVRSSKLSHKHSSYYSIGTTMSQLSPPQNIHSTTAIANMYNLFLKPSSLLHAFVGQDFQLTECFLNNYINDETKNQNNDMRQKYCLQPIHSRSTLKPLCLGNVHVQLIPYQWTNVF